jgi:DNA polymerase-1
MKEQFFLLDAIGFVFRSYFAITPMTNQQGASTHALFGFIRSILKLIKDFDPKYLVAVFDGKDNSKSREEIYSEYKSNRKELPDDLGPQIGLAVEFCKMYGIPVLQIPGIEADDTIASITKWLEEKHQTTYICSSDKDLCQLVTKNTFILNTFKENLIIDEEKVKETFGVRPDQIVDLLAIMGDTSDNIPGIPGFGPKTAAKLLEEFGSLSNLLKNVDKVDSKKKQETIRDNEDLAKLSHKLATLHLDAPFPKDKEFFKLKEPDIEVLAHFYKEMNFKSLLKDLMHSDLFESKEPKKEELECIYHTVDTEEKLQELISHLKDQEEIVIDLETTDIKPMAAKIVGMGLSALENTAYYIPFNLDLSESFILSKLKPILEDPKKKFIGHNIKYDYHVLKNSGIDLKNIYFDTMIASYLLNSESNRHNLDLLSLEILSKKKIPIEDLIGKGKKQISMKEVPIDLITNYCCEDVVCTLRLKNIFEKELKEKNLEKVFREIEMPLVPVLISMERAGIFVDTKKLTEMSEYLSKEISKLQNTIYQECGEIFNLNSPKQLSEVLFQKMGITPVGKKGTSGFSTSASVLEELEANYPVCRKILAYRALEKLRSTYVDSLPEQISPKTHKIHCTFNQSVAATGRLSCQDPNLQNIPTRTEEGKKIRYAFTPEDPENWSFISADYSQIELRILAHLSQDENLIAAFNQNEDIHKSTAALVFNVPKEAVTKEMRDMAKAVNFGILYGQQAFGLSQQLGISVQEASKFINTYFETYPSIKSFLESCKEKARETGVATTFTGRQRPIVDIHSKNGMLRAAAERLAVNTPIQGAQADIIKMAMIKIDHMLKKHPEYGHMILQIHDELIFEVPNEHVEKVKKEIKQIMETIVNLCIPLTVDVSIGKNWGEC